MADKALSFQEFVKGDIESLNLTIENVVKNYIQSNLYEIKVDASNFNTFWCYRSYNEFLWLSEAVHNNSVKDQIPEPGVCGNAQQVLDLQQAPNPLAHI